MELMKDNTERILAIDFGTKRIGIAITDPLKIFSIPLTTILNNSSIWKEFDKIFDKYNIQLIIIGYPTNKDGTKSIISEEVENFSESLNNKFQKNIEFVDERYSSSIAWEHILQGVTSRKKRRNKALIDMNAAAVILEDYLKNN
jgi:putative Holliday junction resolvase